MKINTLFVSVVRSALLVLLAMLPQWSFAESLVKTLPIISPHHFQVGQEYVWQYFEDGILYSTEKYTVVHSDSETTLIEMSTMLAGEESFKIHHRFEASIPACLKAYENPRYYQPWKLKLYYWTAGSWQQLTGHNSNLAFEEKFNCNPHGTKIPGQKAFLKAHQTQFGEVPLFQFRVGDQDRTSWYFFEGSAAGLLAFKRMSKATVPVSYEIRFLGAKNSSGTDLTAAQMAPH